VALDHALQIVLAHEEPSLALGEGLNDLSKLELFELVDADRHLVRVGVRVRLGLGLGVRVGVGVGVRIRAGVDADRHRVVGVHRRAQRP